jgi:chromosome segregation ATPase
LSDDLLERILRLADGEGALAAASLGELARGLRERAALILAERVRPLEERLASLERENAWRADTIEALRSEGERLQREWDAAREAHEAATGETAMLRIEWNKSLEEAARLKEEIEALRREAAAAQTAHDRLLDHHRQLLRFLLGRLVEAASGLGWGSGRAKPKLAEAIEALRAELAAGGERDGDGRGEKPDEGPA